MTTLRELCARVEPELLARSSVERIRRELPRYREIDPREHLEAVRLQQDNQLAALARGEVVGGAALEAAAELARNRARQGVDIEVLIGAYHLGDQALWQALVEASDPGTAELLPRAAGLLLASLHSLSTALTSAYAEASQAMHSRRITAVQRLFELLGQGRVDVETKMHAELLGLDPEGVFVAVAVVGGPVERAGLPQAVARRLAAEGTTAVVGHGPSGPLLLCQRSDVSHVVTLLGEVLGTGSAGVGLARAGLGGAATSLADAQLALLGGPEDSGRRPGPAISPLEDVWPDACVQQQSARLAPVLERAASVAAGHPHLADAVAAYAAHDMHLARAAGALRLHANSLSYRLERWSALSGWDPRTFDGLRRSMAAVRSAGEQGGALVELLDQP